MAACKDPGFIPRSDLTSDEFDEKNEIKDEYGNQIRRMIDVEQFVLGNENNPLKRAEKLEEFRQLEFQSEVAIYDYRYCRTCKIARPPLSSHCNSCGYCVKGYDQ